MKKMQYIISIIVGSIMLAQLCQNIPMIPSAVMQLGINIMGGLMMGFWICMVMIIIMVSIFILQNVVGLVLVLVYGEECTEENKIARILDKVSNIAKALYQIVGAALFGGLGVIGMLYPVEGGRNVTMIIGGVFVLFALALCIQSIRSIVSTIRG